MNYILINEDYFDFFGDELSGYGYTPIKLPKDERLNSMVASHGDTLIFCDKIPIANAEYIKKLPQNLQKRFVAVTDSPVGQYPQDIIFNALRVGDFLFAHKSVSPSISNYAVHNKLSLVTVKQGYARCSTLALPDMNAAITADRAMASAMEKAGIHVLSVTPGHIILKGALYGFIGGASFVNANTRQVYFFGDIKGHPDCQAIMDFIAFYGYSVICLKGNLTDIGGGIIIPQDGE